MAKPYPRGSSDPGPRTRRPADDPHDINTLVVIEHPQDDTSPRHPVVVVTHPRGANSDSPDSRRAVHHPLVPALDDPHRDRSNPVDMAVRNPNPGPSSAPNGASQPVVMALEHPDSHAAAQLMVPPNTQPHPSRPDGATPGRVAHLLLATHPHRFPPNRHLALRLMANRSANSRFTPDGHLALRLMADVGANSRFAPDRHLALRLMADVGANSRFAPDRHLALRLMADVGANSRFAPDR